MMRREEGYRGRMATGNRSARKEDEDRKAEENVASQFVNRSIKGSGNVVGGSVQLANTIVHRPHMKVGHRPYVFRFNGSYDIIPFILSNSQSIFIKILMEFIQR